MGASRTNVLVIGCHYHDFETNGDILADVLDQIPAVDTTVTADKSELNPDRISAYDVLVDYMTDSSMSPSQRDGFLTFVRDGGGYVGIHPAADITNFYDGDGNDPDLEGLLGAGYEGHPEKQEITVQLVDEQHPITIGLRDYTVFDEPYRFSAVGDADVLARTTLPDRDAVPYAWARKYGDGRVVYHANGHTNAACRHPTFQAMFRRAVAWVDSSS